MDKICVNNELVTQVWIRYREKSVFTKIQHDSEEFSFDFPKIFISSLGNQKF